MFGSLVIYFTLPVLDISRIRGNLFRPFMQFLFSMLSVVLVGLGILGGKHPEEPYSSIGGVLTGLYFAWFLVLVPFVGLLENTFMDIATTKKN